MHNAYGETLNYLLKSSKADKTWKTYSSKRKAWERFCNIWKINPYKKHTQEIYTYFTIWRYKTTGNRHSTISQDVSAVISLYNSSTLGPQIDRKKFGVLTGVLQGIARQPGRQSRPTFPIRNILLLAIVNKYKAFNYYNLLWCAIFCFAKNFALRTSEYTAEFKYPNKRTLKWKQLNFHYHKGYKHLSITILISKTNKKFKEEIITKKCCCANKKLAPICPVCTMFNYRKIYQIFFKLTGESYVFLNDDGSLVTSSEWMKEFKLALKYINIDAVYPYWRPHSLRKGEITDLMAAGVDLYFVKKIARHTPQSLTTYEYIQLETDEEAELIANKYIKYF